MNSHIKNAISKGRLVLLLGAGASAGCKNRTKDEVPLGWQLAELLADKGSFSYHDEDLPTVYNAVKRKLGDGIYEILEQNFKHCTPSKEYFELAKYPFARIYTLNIDDALDTALRKNSEQYINIRQRDDKVSQADQFFRDLDFVKLNGDINNIKNGFVFSPQEYGKAAGNMPLWYEELGGDFYKYTFLFVGTQLKEPLFFSQIERYKGRTDSTEQRSYVLVPSMTEIQKESLLSSNMEHLEGTLEDFTNWLSREFDKGLSPSDVLNCSRPELDLSGVDNVDEYQKIFRNVTPVSRASLSLGVKQNSHDSVRNFYKGSKPSWSEILDGVPAFLYRSEIIYEKIVSVSESDSFGLFCVFGNAGCGKTTVLKQIALKISEETSSSVYFVENIDNKIKDLVLELEKRNTSRYFVFIDRLADVAFELGELVKTGRIRKCTFVGAENKSMWSARVKEYLGEFCTMSEDVSHIDERDANNILEKIEQYGNWTRLARMSQKDRVSELVKKSSKQLLIGLMETTSGEGYNEIIKKDFNRLPTKSHEDLLILVGLATAQRTWAHESTITRALNSLGSNPNILGLIKDMDGIVTYRNGNISARHRVYVDRLFDLYIDKSRLFDCISAYVEAFTVYDTPIAKNISKAEFAVYRYLVNAKTLSKYLRDDEYELEKLYSRFEKRLEREGLFLLQYGLMLRSFGKQGDAYNKIHTAHEAFPESPQIEHALALQRIIMASRAETEAIAMSYFSLAKDVLSRLDNANVRVFDAYPIITLSEGHVKIVDKFVGTSEAKVVARGYYDDIQKRLGKNSTQRLRETSEKLQKFYLSGVWIKSEDDLIQ